VLRFLVLNVRFEGRMPAGDRLLQSAYIKRNRQQKRRNELLPYNDCLYRHVTSHTFILIVDIDELVVPLGTLVHVLVMTR